VAYVSYPEGILWKANRDGSGPVRLSDPPVYPRGIAWSPDNTQIVFYDKPVGATYTETYVVSSLGGKPQRMLAEQNEPITDARWSPDGRKLVFSTCDLLGGSFSKPSFIRVLDIASHQVTTLPGSEGMLSPRWSPDGRYIAVLSKTAGDYARVYNLDAKQWTALPHDVDWPNWSKDSRSIYFLRKYTEPGVFRVFIQTGKIEKVADLKGYKITGWYGYWLGLDPTDAPLFLHDVGTEDLYALTLDRK
jgi:dipeptidyl aminopeptidase/acylaminoacyl peptidase